MRRHLAYSVIVIALFAVAFYLKPSRPLEFDSVADAKERIERAGLRCIIVEQSAWPVAIASEKPINQNDAASFAAAHESFIPVGVVRISAPLGGYYKDSETCKHCGNVVLQGDQKLIRIIVTKS